MQCGQSSREGGVVLYRQQRTRERYVRQLLTIIQVSSSPLPSPPFPPSLSLWFHFLPLMFYVVYFAVQSNLSVHLPLYKHARTYKHSLSSNQPSRQLYQVRSSTTQPNIPHTGTLVSERTGQPINILFTSHTDPASQSSSLPRHSHYHQNHPNKQHTLCPINQSNQTKTI